jgi:hypothetical protein
MADLKTLSEIQALSDPVANHWKMAMVTGFASKGGNGSVAVAGLSPASDAPLACCFFGGTGSGHGAIAVGSVTFINGSTRMEIANTTTSNKSVMLFWWDKVA